MFRSVPQGLRSIALFLALGTAAAADEIGTLPGEVAVDNAGRALYSIPIDLPPGTGGVVPTLGLNYSSSGNNGPLGVGWSLSGLSSITRMPSSYFFDDVASGMQFQQTTDRFALDGQRLILTQGSNYGAANTIYRTSLESFNRITASSGTTGSGPTSFTLQSKAGLTSEYGTTSDSRIDFWVDADSDDVVDAGETHVHTWLVSKISDTLGNYMTFHYTHINNVAYIEYIEYTGNSSAGLAPFNQVRFIYESRPDSLESYMADTAISQTKRLKEIQIWQDTTTGNLSSGWFSCKYVLSYDTTNGSTYSNSLSGRSRVSDVQLVSHHDGQDLALSKTLFDWSDRSGNLTEEITTNINSSVTFESQEDKTLLGDFDGDGKQEVVIVDKRGTGNNSDVDLFAYRILDSGTLQQIGSSTRLPLGVHDIVTAAGDVDGDGVDDLVVCRNFDTFYIYRLTTGGFSLYRTHSAYLGVASSDEITIGCFDLDQDGKNELAILYGYPDENVKVFVFDDLGTDDFAWRSIHTEYDIDIDVPDVRQNDINGDGIFDLLVFPSGSSGSSRVRVGSLSTGEYSALTGDDYYQIGKKMGPYYYPIVFPEGKYLTTDFNQDGYTDVVAIFKGTDNQFHLKKYTNLNRTRQYGSYTYFLYSEGNDFDTNIGWNDDYDWFFDDVTDDGNPDLGITVKNSGGDMQLYVRKANGDTFFSSSYESDNTYKNWSDRYSRSMVSDYNGDGVSDLVLFHADNSGSSRPCMIAYEGQGTSTDLMTTVTNGLGDTTTIVYSNLVDSEVYWKEDLTTFPLVTKTTTMTVVKSLIRDDGLGGNYYSDYAFSDARYHMQGLGFLGFESMISYDPQADAYQWKHLEHTYPMMGMVQRDEAWFVPQSLSDVTDVSIASFLQMSKIDNTNIYDAVAGGTLFSMTVQSVDQKWDLRNAADGSISMGNGGNPYLTVTSNTWFDGQFDYEDDDPEIATLPSVGSPEPDHGDYVADCPTLVDYGDIVRTEVAYTTDGQTYTDITVNEYAAVDSSSWLLGRLLVSTATQISTEDPDNPEIRQSAFVYVEGSGLIAAEVEHPSSTGVESLTDPQGSGLSDYTDLLDNDAASKLVVYTRDAYGNILTEQVHFHDLDVNAISDPTVSLPTKTTPTVLNIKTNHFQSSDKGRYPWKVSNINGDAETFTYNPKNGAVLTQTGPNGLTTQYTYDPFGRVNREDRADGTWSVVERELHSTALSGHDNGSEVYYKVTTTGPEVPVSIAYYDRRERPLRAAAEAADGRWIFQDSVYNNRGEVVKASNKYFENTASANIPWTVSSYDDLGRLHLVTAPDGTKTATRFRGLEQETISNYIDGVFSIASPQDDQKSIVRNNAKGKPTWTQDTLGSQLNHTYWANGSVKTSSTTGAHASGSNKTHTVSLWYDARGHKIRMTDPDMGNWFYATNALGQLRWQKDAKLQVTKLFYDNLGRMNRRENAEGTSEWDFYSSADVNQEGAWIGAARYERFHAVGAPTGDYETHRTMYYDHLGRPYLELNYLDEKWFYTYNRYDGLSRVKRVDYFWRPESITDPLSSLWHSFGVENTYNDRGYITSVTDSTGYEWWSIHESNYDQEGRPVDYDYGNGTKTQLTYDPNRPILTDSLVTHLMTTISDLHFEVDPLGNFTGREDKKRSNYERFSYDERNRLKNVKYDLNYSGGTPTATLLSMTYDDFGNISTRTGNVSLGYNVGSYSYGTSRTHAVTAAGSHTYGVYDANGNAQLRDGSSLHWNSFNKPSMVAQDFDWSLFVYDATQSRRIQVSYDNTSGVVKKKLYLGAYELQYTYEPESHPDHTQWETWNYSLAHTRVYISTPAGVVGTLTHDAQASTADAALVRNFFHYDHLGSIVEITGEDGTIAESFSYSPWGQRRNADTFAILSNPAVVGSTATDRGFTGHEMLDNVGLVHMNARLFDPIIGRFLSPDSVLQFPGNIQSYDRYQYVLNNPLSYTDPSGHFIPLIVGIILVAAEVHIAVSIAVMFVAGAVWAAVNGAKGADIFKAGLMSAAMTAVSFGIGELFGSTGSLIKDGVLNGTEIARSAAHGLTGGISSEIQGGDFGSGFASGFVGSIAGAGMKTGKLAKFFNGDNAAAITKRTLASALIGGTTAEIGGGKFANGAATAAIQHLFNAEMHEADVKKEAERIANENGAWIEPMIQKYGREPVLKWLLDASHDFSMIQGAHAYAAGQLDSSSSTSDMAKLVYGITKHTTKTGQGYGDPTGTPNPNRVGGARPNKIASGYDKIEINSLPLAGGFTKQMSHFVANHAVYAHEYQHFVDIRAAASAGTDYSSGAFRAQTEANAFKHNVDLINSAINYIPK